ncbi:MAG TPA: iron-containing alcohol dehydrogenase, partial [Planctomycetia bacterium]|nr:iron-containing alcohol dehydrogenase [Planctomycetia bacterium]
MFGWGRRVEIGRLAASLGTRAFLVCGSRTLERNGTLGQLADEMRRAGVDPVSAAECRREPEVEDVDAAAAELWKSNPRPGDLVVGIGGGAALDMAKALAARAVDRRGDSIQDFLEGVGKGWTLDPAPLPILAVPTTAGTGSEATRNGVISRRSPSFKKSLRDERLMPRIALVDPELTVSNPPHVTAQSGMDALCQLIESFISKKAQPLPQAIAVRGMRGLIPALRKA